MVRGATQRSDIAASAVDGHRGPGDGPARRCQHSGELIRNEWTVACYANRLEFIDIPWSTMYNMAYGALEAARDWISPDNYVS